MGEGQLMARGGKGDDFQVGRSGRLGKCASGACGENLRRFGVRIEKMLMSTPTAGPPSGLRTP